MDNKEFYILAQFDKDTQGVLSNYYNILRQQGFSGNQTKDVPYHFTLGKLSYSLLDQTMIKLDKICSETKPFDIRLDHIGLFGLNVLFIEPNMNLELLNLQKSLFSDCGNGCHLWTAHSTILMDNEKNILSALPCLTKNFKPFSAVIGKISLYSFSPTRLIKYYNL